MPYCIYLRKSRADMDAEARGEGETLARHKAALFELARRLNLPVDHIYQEIVSGDSIASRPEMQKLLNDVQTGKWEGVLCMEVERLARGDTMDQGLVAQTFKFTSTKIITPQKIYDPLNDMDEEYFEFSLFMSRREYKTIKRRLQAGRVASVKEGHYMGSVAPYGYDRIRIAGQKGYTLSINPKEAPIVRMVFDWAAHGMDGRSMGGGAIASQLNKMNLKSNRGGTWTQNRISAMIRNPVYIGMVQWYRRTQTVSEMRNGRPVKRRELSTDKHIIVRGLHEPIVDEVTFSLANKNAKQRYALPLKSGKTISNPLAGLVRCGVCGHTMRQMSSGNGKYPPILTCPTVGCQTVGSPIWLVEGALIRTLQDWLKICESPLPEPDHRAEAIAHANAAARAQLAAQISTIKQQQSKIHDLLEQGIYDVETFLSRSNELSTRLASLNASMAAIEDQPATDNTSIIRSMEGTIRSVLTAYDLSETPAYRNELLRSVISHAVYQKTIRAKRGESPSEHLTLEAFPNAPSS